MSTEKTDTAGPTVLPTKEEMAKAVQSDRGCCFMLFYKVSGQVANYTQATATCPECNITWLLGRLDLTLTITPVGVKPRVELVKGLPDGMKAH